MKESTLLELGSTSPLVDFGSLSALLTRSLAAIAKLICAFLEAKPTPTATYGTEREIGASFERGDGASGGGERPRRAEPAQLCTRRFARSEARRVVA